MSSSESSFWRRRTPPPLEQLPRPVNPQTCACPFLSQQSPLLPRPPLSLHRRKFLRLYCCAWSTKCGLLLMLRLGAATVVHPSKRFTQMMQPLKSLTSVDASTSEIMSNSESSVWRRRAPLALEQLPRLANLPICANPFQALLQPLLLLRPHPLRRHCRLRATCGFQATNPVG